jgi:hypothetical protein
MKSVAALLVLVAFAPVATATTDGQPKRIKMIGNWRHHDPVAPQFPDAERWTPRDVVGFLGRFPDAMMDGGYRDGQPPGNTYWRDLGGLIDQARAIANEQGVPFEGRMCISERPDVMTRFRAEGSCHPSRGGGGCDWEGDMDGALGEAETVVKRAGRATAATETSLTDTRGDWEDDFWRHRLLVLRPGPGEERRRIGGNTATSLSVDSAWLQPPRPGDRYEIRGSFDPSWVKRIPRSAHQETVRRLWEQQRNVCGPPGASAPCNPAAEPLDPLDPANHRAWPEWLDRAAIEALATPSEVPALYGSIFDGVDKAYPPSAWLDPYFRISTVVMNVADPAYREWRIRYFMYKLRDHSLSRGAPACMILSYKAAWYTFYDEAELGPSPDACATSGSNLWSGPAHVCQDGRADGGPFVSGLYERGGYEGAINAYIRETLTRLAQSGWTDLRIITMEGAAIRSQAWSILADDVRRSPNLLGVWDGVLDPPLSLLDEVAADPTPVGDTSTGNGSSASPAAASEAPARGGFVTKSGGGGGGIIEPPPSGP